MLSSCLFCIRSFAVDTSSAARSILRPPTAPETLLGLALDSLATVMDKHWPIRNWHSEFKGSSCAYFFRKEIPSGTIELSQSHLANGKYLTIEDYLSFGKGTVIAFNEYYIKGVQ